MEPGARAAYTLRVQEMRAASNPSPNPNPKSILTLTLTLTRVQEMRVAVGQPRCSASRSCVYRPMSRLPPSVFHPTIVDSGTTFMYHPS